MIYVEREDSAEVRGVLEKRGLDGRNELERAVGHYLQQDPAKPPGFHAYRSDVVRRVLNELFHGKCAYCETRYAAAAPMDVEHYRPKNGYVGDDGKLVSPGYYWLAAEWTNLLPSCIDCNRERWQDHQTAEGRTIRFKTGKKNRFPLAPGSRRATRQGEEADEAPLLLDATVEEEPSHHLRFEVTGLVLPARGEHEEISPRGETTIAVCGLNRVDLFRDRAAIVLRLREVMEDLCGNLCSVLECPGKDRFRRALERKEASLEAFMDPKEPHAGLARQIVASFRRVFEAAVVYKKALVSFSEDNVDPLREAAVRSAFERLDLLASEAATAELIPNVLTWLELDVPDGLGRSQA